MKRRIVLTKIEQRLVRFSYENNELIAIDVVSHNESSNKSDNSELRVGEFYTARVKNIVNNIEAAFVQIQEESCYFSMSDNADKIFLNSKKDQTIHIGDLLLVQVEREAVKTKQTCVGCNYQLTGELLVFTPNKPGIGLSKKLSSDRRGELQNWMNEFSQLPVVTDLIKQTNAQLGFIVRTNASNATKEQLEQEYIQLLSRWKDILQKARTAQGGIKLYGNQDIYSEMLQFIGTSSKDQNNYIITDQKECYQQLQTLVAQRNTVVLSDLDTQQNDTNAFDIRMHDKETSLSTLYDLHPVLKDALSKKVWLKSGGFLIIEPTEALTVIDVNTGKSVQKHASKEEHCYHINLEAADEIARQLRIRNYSGIIIVDFIDMKNEENKEALLNHIRHLLKLDSVKSTLIDITGLGLVELTRKKIKKPLHEQWETN